VALTGLHISRNAIPVGEIAESSRIPMISGKSTNPKTTAGRQYVFRVAFLDPFQAQVLARFSRHELGKSKAAVLFDEASAYNKGLAENYKQAFEEAGGQVVAFEAYVTNDEDFSKQLTAIKDSGAEILFLPNYFHEVPNQVKQARELGLTIPLIGSDSWGVLKKEDLPLVEGGFFTTHFAPDVDTDVAQKFVTAYQAAYGKDPIDTAAATYDAMGLLFKAITSQGKADPESIRQGIANLGQYQGVTGNIEYKGSGDPVKSAVIMQVKDGVAKFYKFATP
jgi:branched-chain amino acid transport system substrate-binding protein